MDKCVKVFAVLALVLATVQAHDPTPIKRSLSHDCKNSYSMTCLKLDIVSWVDKLAENDKLNVLPGVSLVSEGRSLTSNTELVAEVSREFPNSPDKRLDSFLMKKLTGFLGSRSIRVNLFDSQTKDTNVSGRKKDKHGVGTALALAAMMKAMLFAVGLKGLAFMSGTALMTGLLSLVLSSVIGLKSLSGGGGHRSTTYEIVSKPVYSPHSSSREDVAYGSEPMEGPGSYGPYKRSFDRPLPLSLQPGYIP